MHCKVGKHKLHAYKLLSLNKHVSLRLQGFPTARLSDRKVPLVVSFPLTQKYVSAMGVGQRRMVSLVAGFFYPTLEKSSWWARSEPVTTAFSCHTIAPLDCFKMFGKHVCTEVVFHHCVAIFQMSSFGTHSFVKFFISFQAPVASMLLSHCVHLGCPF